MEEGHGPWKVTVIRRNPPLDSNLSFNSPTDFTQNKVRSGSHTKTLRVPDFLKQDRKAGDSFLMYWSVRHNTNGLRSHWKSMQLTTYTVLTRCLFLPKRDQTHKLVISHRLKTIRVVWSSFACTCQHGDKITIQECVGFSCCLVII